MRVLYLINYAGKAGTEKYVENLVDHLHGNKCECQICYNIDGPLADKMRERGVKCHKLEMRSPFDKKAAKRLAEICREEGIDVIHAQYPRENYIAILSKKYYPAPKVVFTSHLIIAQNAVWKFFNRRMTKKDHRVIAVCSAGKKALIANGVPEDRIEIIWNGVIPGDAPAVREPGRARPAIGEELPDGAVVAFIMARLSPEKGLDFLIDAAKKAIDGDAPVYVYVAGDGDERAPLEEKIKSYGLEDRIRLLGYRTDTAALLADADIYLNTSENEAMSIAILEAMAAGLPLIVTGVGGNVELVETAGVCGETCAYGDADALADALSRFAADPELRAGYGRAARAKTENEFELTRLLDKVYESYK